MIKKGLNTLNENGFNFPTSLQPRKLLDLLNTKFFLTALDYNM